MGLLLNLLLVLIHFPFAEICPTTALSHSLQGTNQSDQPRTFDNKLLPETANTLIDSQQEEAQHGNILIIDLDFKDSYECELGGEILLNYCVNYMWL